jgi:HME family heavy-metal exporter
MLDKLIRICLEYRLVVLVLAGTLLVFGAAELAQRPVDIFPDLNQPTVTVLAEAPGYAPEEVETLVTLPLESALVGAPGVEKIRSISQDGLTIVRADFGWKTDIYRDRQLVQERLQLASENLPEGVVPEMAPISSLTGQIMDLGLISPDDSVSQMDLQTLAEWTIRRRLLAVQGVSQVVIIGGDRRQYQVLVDPDKLARHHVDLKNVAEAVSSSSQNTSGGYLVEGNRELLVRNLGRLQNVQDLKNLVVASRRQRPVRIHDLARVKVGPEFPRGAASVEGKPGVVMEIFKQPEADTLALSEAIDKEIMLIRQSLPKGVELRNDLFRQATFLNRGVSNVIDALRDGAILVVLVLLLFLMNMRASVITLVALPLSFATTGILFSFFDLTINTMTLGGLAIAVGELVDDAIVGVENIVRRLRQPLKNEAHGYRNLIADASSEVRGPIFTGTLVVVLVFVPLFALTGIEGRLFSPLAVAYVVSLLASMVVSLSVTPVLALFLFRKQAKRPQREKEKVSFAMRGLYRFAHVSIKFGIARRKLVLTGSAVIAILATGSTFMLGSQFLPEFDEGTILVMTQLPPGTSLEESRHIVNEAEKRLTGMAGVRSIHSFTGRGLHDEHAPPVGISHLMLTLDTNSGISRQEMIDQVRSRLATMKGVNLSVGQPLAHRIDHLMTGVQAQIVIKVSGENLDVLRTEAKRVAAAARTVAGVTDLYIEPQVLVSQLHIKMKRQRLAELGLSPGDLCAELEIAIGGKVVGQLLKGERSFDLFVRLHKPARSSIQKLKQLPIRLPHGDWARLEEVAWVKEDVGPNAISRDHLVRRIAVSCNVTTRSVGEVVSDLKTALAPIQAAFPEGTYLRFEGQFAAQQQATQSIAWLSLLSLAAMMLILYGQFRSFNLAFQVLTCIPAAFIGGIAMLLLTGQTFNIAALVGFISLAGIATRNGILLVTHYLNLMRKDRVKASVDLIIKAGQQRAAPVVMTALTTGAGLLPLLLSAGESGREILYPVASVVIGGLITSTLFEFLLRPALFWSLGQKAAERVAHQ